jgi:5-methylcytosine-specific restriction endonuclease McrA
MILSIEEIINIIGQNKKVKLGENFIYVKSERLKCFKNSGIVCKHCGVVGKFFAVERDKVGHSGWHLNLYAINSYGDEVLMTADHIIPRSRGGDNDVSNLQTLCTKCNHAKGNKMEGEL